MALDRLVCANCAAPVSEGRCPVCRAHRARLAQDGGPVAGLSPVALVTLLIVLITATAVLATQTP